MEKKIKVVFSNKKLKKAFEDLKKGTHEEQKLHSKILTTIEKLEINPLSGNQIPRRLIPKEYKEKNIWKVNLDSSWRLIYTLAQNKVEVLTVVLEWFSHKKYERKFKYKKV